MLADPKIDAVVLATPASGHLKQIEAAAAAGKHVYCEKPFTFSKKEAEAALDAVRKAKRVVGVGYNRRFHPEMVKLHDRIKAGELGTIQHIEASMTYPNALFLPPTAWRSQQDRGAARRARADGRACHRRDDLSRRRDRPRSIARASRAWCRTAPTTPPRCCSA